MDQDIRALEQEKELSQDFTFWSLLKYVAPSIFVFVFIAVYQMVDGFFIDMFVDEVAISAINLYYPIICLFIALGIMFGTGGNAMIVKLVGEGDRKKAGQVFSELMIFAILTCVIITAVCLVFPGPIMRLCGATDGTIGYLRPYYFVMSSFAVAILMQSMLGILVIGEGKTVTAAIVIMIGGVLNCVLDYVFMKHLHMGIKGAAIATVIGYCSTIVYAFYYYVLGHKSSYRLELTKIHLKDIGQICFNGSSDLGSNLAGGLTVLFMNHIAFRCYGDPGVSSLSVWSYLEFFISAVFMGYTTAAEPLFSYHYGTGNREMRKKLFGYSMKWSVILGVVLMALLFLFRSQVIGLFFDPGTAFYDISMEAFLWSLPACVLIGINNFVSGMFTAYSNGLVSFILSMFRTFVAFTACVYGLSAIFGGTGLWAAWPVAEVLSLIPTYYCVKKYNKRYGYM